MMRNIKHVSSNVATVIPEIGFEEEPISPVSLDETVTNKKPKAMMRMAPVKATMGLVIGSPSCGNAMIMPIKAMMPPITNFIERS